MDNWFEIRVPKSTEWKPSIAATFTQALCEYIEAWMDLQLVCTHEAIRWIVFSHKANEMTMEKMQSLVSAYYPGAEVSVPEDWAIAYPYYRRSIIFAHNETDFFETFASVHSFRSSDPFATAIQTLDVLEPGEVLTYHLQLLGLRTFTQEEMYELMTISAYDAGWRPKNTVMYRMDWAETIGATIGTYFRKQELKKQRVWRYEESDLERFVGKLQQKLVEVAVYLRLDTPKPERLAMLNSVVSTIKHTGNEGRAKIVDGLDRSGQVTNDAQDNALWPGNIVIDWYAAEDDKQADKISKRDLVFPMSPEEIAALYHLPHENCTANRIQWIRRRPMPDALKTIQDSVRIGTNGKHQVRLPDEERTQHAIIVGKPGTGKSTLMLRMIIEDVIKGRGICVVDPHGMLIRDVLRYGIPAHRAKDVVILDFANEVNPPPLNPLYRPSGIAEDIATDMVMAVMTKIYEEFALKEMADTMHMALLLLTAETNPTLLDVNRVFEDLNYRQGLIDKLDDFTVTSFWERFNSLSVGKREEMIRPVLRRLNAFYRNKALRAIACHPKPLNTRQLVADGKIILVDLAADAAKIPGEERDLLGAILVSQIQMAAMAGAIKNAPFLLYIDEAQNFVTTGLNRMLAEARKQGLGITLANQYLKQLTGDTLDAVEGTVSTMIAFEVGESDARAFAPYMKPQFQVADLVTLGKHQAAISMRYQNVRHPAFTLETLPPPNAENEDGAQAREQALRRQSVENYTPKTYSEVNDWLRNRYNPAKANGTSDTAEGGTDDLLYPAKEA